MVDDLVKPLDFTETVNMYKESVIPFVWLNLMAHSIIPYYMYRIAPLLHWLLNYELVTHPLVNMMAEQTKVLPLITP